MAPGAAKPSLPGIKGESVDKRENLRFPGPSFEINWMKQFTQTGKLFRA
jgi:hypothetical protein